MPSTKCIELVEKRLSMFGLCLETDIVSIVTDGASVMTKVGKQIVADTGPAQQLCFAHGLQLAVRSLYIVCTRKTFKWQRAFICRTQAYN